MIAHSNRFPRGLAAVIITSIALILAYIVHDYFSAFFMPSKFTIGVVGFSGLFMLNIGWFLFSVIKACFSDAKVAQNGDIDEDLVLASLEGRAEISGQAVSSMELPVGVFAGFVVGSCIAGIISALIT